MGFDNFRIYNRLSVTIIAIAIITNLVNIPAIVFCFTQGMPLPATIWGVFLMAFNISLFYINGARYLTLSIITLILLALALWTGFLYGRHEFAGVLALFIYPVFAYFLVGWRKCIATSIIFLNGLLILYVASRAQIFDPVFTWEEVTGYLATMASMLMMLYFMHTIGVNYKAQLKGAVKNYEDLLDHLPVAVLMVNSKFHIIAANQMARNWFPKINSSEQKICYRTVETALGDSFCPGCPVEKAFEDGKSHSFEQVRHTDEGEQVFRVIAKPMIDKHGQVYAVTKMMDDITLKKRLESQLAETENMFRSLGQHTTAAIFLLRDNVFVSLNPALARITGYMQDDLLKMNISEIVHHDYRGLLTDTIASLISGTVQVAEFELKIITVTGQERWVDFTLAKTQIAGQITLTGTLFDITERKWAEDTLHNEQHYFSFLMDNIPHQIYFKDLQSRFVRLNKSITKRFGLQHAGEAIGKTDFDFFTTEHAQQAFNDEQSIITTGIPKLDIVEKETWPDGSITWASTSKMMFNDYKGRVAGIFGVSKDITELWNAREELRISEENYRKTAKRYEAFIDASNTGAWEYDLKNDTLWCSPRYFSMLGRSHDDFAGTLNFHTWSELLHPEDRQRAIQYYNDYIRQPSGLYQQVFRLSHSSGDYRWILSRGQLLRDEDKTMPDLMVGTHIDITEEKLKEDVIMSKNKELESFLYIASHDLRSPLINIEGFSNRIEKQVAALGKLVNFRNGDNKGNAGQEGELHKILHEGIPRSLTFIYSNVKKMDSLISGLLNISRTGKMKLTITKINMKSLIERVLATAGYQIEKSGAKIEIGAMPYCYGDPHLINQLFSNIIDNAVKYRKIDTPLIISVEGVRRASEVIYKVTDNGQGIEHDKISKIWEVFYRADPKSSLPGEGIGLNLALKIADRHRGKIWAESTPLVGTTFYVQLPAVPFDDIY